MRPGRIRSPPTRRPIAAALASLGEPVGDAAGQAAADELTVWLPSAADGPQAAPELIEAGR